MKIMIVHNLILLILFVTFSECHDYQQNNQNYGVRGQPGQNIKSYGGYFHDTARHNEATNNFVNTQHHNSPPIPSYQPYGWNFNQPTRTYGGVNVVSQQQSPNNQDSQHANRIGWANNNNYGGLNPSPFFPTMPQPNLFFPNFFPQFPFQPFPNMFPYGNNYPQGFPNYPTGPQTNRDNSQGPNNVQPNHNQLPYPQPNINQGFPTPNTNQNTGGTGIIPSNQGQIPYPQNNINQAIPTGSHIRNPGETFNFKPQPDQSTINRVASTESTRVIVSTTVQPSTSTISNSLFGDNNEGVDFQFPQAPDFPKPNEIDPSSGVDIRNSKNNHTNSGSDKDDGFASNSFFENNDRRQWTKDDELKWLATTKAPYFENKVPGLECTLPAAAVLGAKNAFKVSTLLPLDVPPGKPLLSCNATDLLQSQIRLDGRIYHCSNSDIAISCLTHGDLIDECEGQILQCDTDNYNVENVWCTNGTLVSKSDIECRDALVEAHKSTLNCFFKNTQTPSIQTTTRAPFVNVLPVLPLPNTNIDNRNEDDFDYGDIGQQTEIPQGLMPEVKGAMQNVFPHDLLTMPSTRYLPQKASMQPIDKNLQNHISTVFNTDMLASSRNENEGPNSSASRSHYDFSHVRDQTNSNLNNKPNDKTADNSSIKTKPSPADNRFGGGNNQQHQNLRDRLIFSD